MAHHSLCKMTNGGFLYDCRCDDEEYLQELLHTEETQ